MSTLGTKGKLSKTEIMFGENTYNNINGKLMQKRESYTITCLSRTRNKFYQTK